MKRTLIVYGNCQAGLFANWLERFNGIAARHDVRYVMSFDHPTEPQQTPADAELSRCSLVLEQVDSGRPLPGMIRDRLPEDVATVRFPSLDFNLLWPLQFNDPRNVSEPPDFPFGRFPYGDRVVVELLREGLSGVSLSDAYYKRSLERMPDLARLLEHELKRLAARDRQSDVKFGELVMANYATTPLFWTINHPTGWLLTRAFAELLSTAGAPLGLSGDPRGKAIQMFSSWEPYANYHQPIHPEVAQRLHLGWCSEDRTYRYFDGRMMGFMEFMQRYIDFR